MECAAWSRSNLQVHHCAPLSRGVKQKQMKESCVACEVLRGSEVHPSTWMFWAKPLVLPNRTDRHHVAKCSGGKSWITRLMPLQLVTIEGNIGTGKTTIARLVAKHIPDCAFFPAPDPESNPHWSAFQKEPHKHALAMQIWFLRARLRTYIEALRYMNTKQESVILDFSVWSDIIFGTLHFQQGHLTAEEFSVYQELSRKIDELGLPPPHLTIVLHANPTECVRRCETSLTRSNTPTLDTLHMVDALIKQRWLRDKENVFTPRWLKAERVAPEAPGLPAAPSMLVLVRDWSDLSRVKLATISDAVFCTDPTSFDAWIGPWKAETVDARVEALLQDGGDSVNPAVLD